MKINNIDAYARKVLDMGVGVYVVGGYVRDLQLEKPSHDMDYVIVGATKSVIANMTDLGFEKVGADFPVYLSPNGDEFALARIEKKVGAGYLGFEVDTQSVAIEEDLSRRDLTINSMAISLQTGELVDPFGGKDDLRNKVIRNTTESFREDPLRMLRVGRFYSKLEGFTIAPETIKMILSMRDEIKDIPHERIIEELKKVNSSSIYKYFSYLSEVGLLGRIYPFISDIEGFLSDIKGQGSLNIPEIIGTMGLHSVNLPDGELEKYRFPADCCKMFDAAITAGKTIKKIDNGRDLYSVIYGKVFRRDRNMLMSFLKITDSLSLIGLYDKLSETPYGDIVSRYKGREIKSHMDDIYISICDRYIS